MREVGEVTREGVVVRGVVEVEMGVGAVTGEVEEETGVVAAMGVAVVCKEEGAMGGAAEMIMMSGMMAYNTYHKFQSITHSPSLN